MNAEQLDLFGAPPAPPDPRDEHPAQWTEEILAAIAPRIPRGTWVHDPFAGTGHRLGRVADFHGWTFTGTEIRAVFIVDPRVRHGDATDPGTYPTGNHVITTSPVYGNGMADNFKARNPIGRNTYRAAAHRLLGYDDPPHPNDMGQYGYRGGRRPEQRVKYWDLANRAAACWTASRVFVDVKDFTSGTTYEHVVDEWADVLERHGYIVVDRMKVRTRGNRFGANRERVDHEVVLVGDRETS